MFCQNNKKKGLKKQTKMTQCSLSDFSEKSSGTLKNVSSVVKSSDL